MQFKESIIYSEADNFKPSRLKHISRDQIELLYHYSYWDGPLSGVCTWRNKRYWFECVKEERVIWENQPGDPDYIDPHGEVPPEWQWIFKHGYKSPADLEDLNEDSHAFRYMALIELTPEEWEAEDKRMAAWRKYIGRHCDYDKNGKRPLGNVGSEAGGPCNWDAYKAVKNSLPPWPPSDLASRPKVGFFLLWEDEAAWRMLQEKTKKGLTT